MQGADDLDNKIKKLKAQIDGLEELRHILGDETTDRSITSLLLRINEIEVLSPKGNTIIGNDLSIKDGDFISRDKIVAGPGNIISTGQIFIYPQRDEIASENKPEALKRYLDNIIESNRHLHLQGIRAGGQPISVELERIFISLSIQEKKVINGELPEKSENDESNPNLQPIPLSETLKLHRRLVLVGDPGCGKTTLLSYLALTYARDLRDNDNQIAKRLNLNERNILPILLPLRNLGRYLQNQFTDSSRDGPAILFKYLHEYYTGQSIDLHKDFFLVAVENGQAIVLLDGMDEIADPKLRQRVARLIEKLVIADSGEIAHRIRGMSHSKGRKNTGKDIVTLGVRHGAESSQFSLRISRKGKAVSVMDRSIHNGIG